MLPIGGAGEGWCYIGLALIDSRLPKRFKEIL